MENYQARNFRGSQLSVESGAGTCRLQDPGAADFKLLEHARDKHDLAPLVIHDKYLINLASIDPVIRSNR